MTLLSFDDLRPLAANLPPVVMLCSVDYGGSGSSALELTLGLHRAGVDAKMLVLESKRGADGVITATAGGKPARVIYAASLAAALRRYRNRPYGYEHFTLEKSAVVLEEYEAVKRAGLIYLHYISGLVSFPHATSALQGKPLVWTLSNTSPFTGGCICTAGCAKFAVGGCARCPQLGVADDGKDIAAENFAAKRNAYPHLHLHIATRGRWIAGCARSSMLLGAFPQTRVPGSIDVNTFSPMPREEARARFGLPRDRKIVVHVAYGGAARRNKGGHVLLQALQRLRSQYRKDPPLLLVIGGQKELPLQGYECRYFDFIDDKATLAAAYSAADVYVSPSFQEVFGRTTAEAQACGTPGVGFYNTGAEDIIQDGVTGHLARHPGLPLENGAVPSRDGAYFSVNPESVADLAEKIQTILELPPAAYAAMRQACRTHALAEYSQEMQTARFLLLYRRILGLPEIPFPASLDVTDT